MVKDFPDNPDVGDIFETWQWSGSSWQSIAGAGGRVSITTQPTPPVEKYEGDLWFNTEIGTLFVYYDDDTSAQWVDVSSDSTGSNSTGLTIVSDTQPFNVDTGDIWFNSSTGIASIYYDQVWIDMGGGDGSGPIVVSNSAPQSPVIGTLWFDTETGVTSVFYDNTWVDIGGSGQTITTTEVSIETAYPVGSIYMNATNGTNPSSLLGFGQWELFGSGKMPIGFDSNDGDFDSSEETGGAKTHQLLTTEMPSVIGNFKTTRAQVTSATGAFSIVDNSIPPSGNINSSVDRGSSVNFDNGGGDLPHNNMPPYIVVYMWKRTS